MIKETAAPGAVPPGNPYPYEGVETTTHLTTSDKSGNVVSYTFTIESTGGSGLVVPGFGFLLNNELTDFNFDSTTHPNRVEGGKRPRSSMAPTIQTRAGEPFLALGSPGGGATIFTNAGEIGAATGIEFLVGGGVLAAAEPVRRGGGSAMTELPQAAVLRGKGCKREAGRDP